MKSKRLLILTILLLLVGCSSSNESGNAASKSSSQQRPAASERHESMMQQALSTITKPINISDLPAQEWTPQADREQYSRYHWPSDFKLPIEIFVELPEVPPEIDGPSPPIQQTD